MIDVKPGDIVYRHLGTGDKAAFMSLKVTEIRHKIVGPGVKRTVIVCGPWEFDAATGAEIDEELGWGVQVGDAVYTGSYITAEPDRG